MIARYLALVLYNLANLCLSCGGCNLMSFRFPLSAIFFYYAFESGIIAPKNVHEAALRFKVCFEIKIMSAKILAQVICVICRIWGFLGQN